MKTAVFERGSRVEIFGCKSKDFSFLNGRKGVIVQLRVEGEPVVRHEVKIDRDGLDSRHLDSRSRFYLAETSHLKEANLKLIENGNS